jgi:phage baseplate assembly protein W
LQLIFAPNSPELAATVQFTVQAALQRWLGDVIDVQDLQVDATDSTLSVDLKYIIRRTGQQETAVLMRQV